MAEKQIVMRLAGPASYGPVGDSLRVANGQTVLLPASQQEYFEQQGFIAVNVDPSKVDVVAVPAPSPAPTQP